MCEAIHRSDGWYQALDELVRPLIEALWTDAFTAPWLCADATGVLVQQKDECRKGHFWVVAAPAKHVLELAPAYWKKTLEQEDTQQRLAANVFRQVAIGALTEHRPVK